MTDRTDHRAEAERLLADADEWGQQAGELSPEASELSCLAYAQLHALFAIHDALTDRADPTPTNPLTVTHPWPSTLPGVAADDRYAANEAKPDPLDESHDESLPEVYVYTVYRWTCPCGNVMKSDADFNDVEVCSDCGLEVRVL